MVAITSARQSKPAARKAGSSRMNVPARTERVAPAPFQFTVAEYYRLGECGFLNPDGRVELINGQVVMMPPIDPPHAFGTHKTEKKLERLLGESFDVRCQHPLTLNETNEPMPDLAVVISRDYSSKHPGPADTCLVIEVADSSLKQDLTTKRDLYAQAAIKEYWVLDICNRQLHVFTKPRKGSYMESRIFAEVEEVTCSTVKALRLKVKELLPTA